MTVRFKVGADIRAWTEFELADATPEEIATLLTEDEDAVALVRALYEAESDRLIELGTEYDDNPDLLADYAHPAVLDVEEEEVTSSTPATLPAPPAEPEPVRVDGYILLTADMRWGWGATLEEAKATARRAGARSVAKGNRAVYRLPAGARGAWVDQMGQVRWDWADDAPSRTDAGEWIEEPR
jgi:hypothetical protein